MKLKLDGAHLSSESKVKLFAKISIKKIPQCIEKGSITDFHS